jgi:hypothetical protein
MSDAERPSYNLEVSDPTDQWESLNQDDYDRIRSHLMVIKPQDEASYLDYFCMHQKPPVAVALFNFSIASAKTAAQEIQRLGGGENPKCL